jgi:hypothetical protein
MKTQLYRYLLIWFTFSVFAASISLFVALRTGQSDLWVAAAFMALSALIALGVFLLLLIVKLPPSDGPVGRPPSG